MKNPLFFALSAAMMLVALPYSVFAQVPGQQTEAELQAAAARAEEFRRKAGDFEAESYFPSEWIVAEALYADARRISGGGYGVTEAIEAYTIAANSFASMFRLSVSLYAQAREDEIMMIRDGLVAAGARAVFPELAGPADRAALVALDLYGTGDYYAAKESAAKAYTMFRILENTFGAWQIRREIVRLGFIDYSRDNYERAEAALDEAVREYVGGEFPAALENAIEAQARFTLALSAGWAALAEQRSSLAKVERFAAVEARANISAREMFERADSLYDAAVDSVRMEYYREAAGKFAEAMALYTFAKTFTLERRRLAAEAIREANRQIEELIRAAQEAELNIN